MLQEQEIRPVLPYTRPKTKEEFFKKHDYVYDEHYDCYLCPANAILSYETTNRAGYKMYRSNPAICQACPFRTQCTESKEAVKVLVVMFGLNVWKRRTTFAIQKKTNGFTQSEKKP
ncbi:transposase [Paenibacillus larvae]|uniref:transposase n=1 Tax=Paenibacillus larvae TaxID=1464 RepID=UPI0037C75BA7